MSDRHVPTYFLHPDITEPLMQIYLNGEAYSLDRVISLAELIELTGLTGKRLAIELNLDIVPRSQHAETLLSDGDRVEIVHAIGGG